jgi:hypothetical protein
MFFYLADDIHLFCTLGAIPGVHLSTIKPAEGSKPFSINL